MSFPSNFSSLTSCYQLPCLLKSSFSLKLQPPPWRGGRVQGYASQAAEHGSRSLLLQKNKEVLLPGVASQKGSTISFFNIEINSLLYFFYYFYFLFL